MHNNIKGWSLIEILVVVAIFGVLAAIGIASLLNGRARAQEAGAEAYAANVYKVAFAHVAADANHVLVTGDCRESYIAGKYNISGSSPVTKCEVKDLGNGMPRVIVESATGKEFSLP